MAWEELDFDKAHVAYFIIGGFTSLFMLCSLFIKEKLYIGEATVATIVGLIFGPHGAGLFDPASWTNIDKLTLELSRIVLVVQCFAVGVELPKAYMERHWRSLVFLLVPVMTLGWLITSVIIFLCIYPLTWLESLAIAACVTATDPVLASSVVGKGKFAKRVPKHLRDVLSAESGCNDGMAFPFIYLSFYLLRYYSAAKEVTFHWIVFIILYECIFGAVYGFLVGYIGRHAIKYAERHSLIDRDSFLVFYFVLALFCAGSASGLGLDDLLVGFAAGIGFSNDGWFVEKTEESHVSNVIDLLLNLSYFVFLGAIIPWQDYDNPEIGLQSWRLVIIAIAVILFRRIPAMLLMKPLIPDVKNWREALFAGHFGPIGVGAIFAVILLRAELETDTTEPLADLPGLDTEYGLLIRTSWPIVTFLVISSILVHGSSIAVFTLGKRINTLTLTLSYTTEGEQNWMDRLPRIASRSKSMSFSRGSKLSQDSSPEDDKDFAPGTLGPIGIPHNFLRRERESDVSGPLSLIDSRRSRHRRRRKLSAGGPIDESAIAPVWRQRMEKEQEQQNMGEVDDLDIDEEDALDDEKGDMKQSDESPGEVVSPEIEVYREGDDLIVEDAEGNVIDKKTMKDHSPEEVKKELKKELKELSKETSGEHAINRHHPHERNEGEELQEKVLESAENPVQTWKKWLNSTRRGTESGLDKPEKPKPHAGAAQAYQYGDKIIVEDADGEVIKTYEIPRQSRVGNDQTGQQVRRGIQRMSTWTFGRPENTATPTATSDDAPPQDAQVPTEDGGEDEDDKKIRFRVGGSDRRMSKQDFIKQIQQLDPKARISAVDQVDGPEDMKSAVKSHAQAENKLNEHGDGNFLTRKLSRDDGTGIAGGIGNFLTRRLSRSQSGAVAQRQPEPSPSRSARRPSITGRRRSSSEASSHGLSRQLSARDIPSHDVRGSIVSASAGQPETSAQRRRRLAAARASGGAAASGPAHSPPPPPPPQDPESDSDDDGTARVPPAMRRQASGKARQRIDLDDEEETAAERRRRLAALGHSAEDSDSESNDGVASGDDEGGGVLGGGSAKRPALRVSGDGTTTAQNPSTLNTSALPAEPPRARIRDRAVGAGGTGGAARNVVPNSPIAEEDETPSPRSNSGLTERLHGGGQQQDASSAVGTPVASPPAGTPVRTPIGGTESPTPSDSPRNPGIRFAEMPRGEGKGRSRRFGRTMGMKGRK